MHLRQVEGGVVRCFVLASGREPSNMAGAPRTARPRPPPTAALQTDSVSAIPMMQAKIASGTGHELRQPRTAAPTAVTCSRAAAQIWGSLGPP